MEITLMLPLTEETIVTLLFIYVITFILGYAVGLWAGSGE